MGGQLTASATPGGGLTMTVELRADAVVAARVDRLVSAGR